MILHTHALLGEVLAFRLGKETILLRTGWPQFDEEKRADLPDGNLHRSYSAHGFNAKRSGLMKKPVVIGLAIAASSL